MITRHAQRKKGKQLERSTTRGIGRIEKHVHELIAAIEVYGPMAGMTDAERADVPKGMKELIDSLWGRKKLRDAAQRAEGGDQMMPWDIED